VGKGARPTAGWGGGAGPEKDRKKTEKRNKRWWNGPGDLGQGVWDLPPTQKNGEKIKGAGSTSFGGGIVVFACPRAPPRPRFLEKTKIKVFPGVGAGRAGDPPC